MKSYLSKLTTTSANASTRCIVELFEVNSARFRPLTGIFICYIGSVEIFCLELDPTLVARSTDAKFRIPFKVGSAAKSVRTERSFIHAGAIAPGPAFTRLANKLFDAHLTLFDAGARLDTPIFRRHTLHLRHCTVNCRVYAAARCRLKHLGIVTIGLYAARLLCQLFGHLVLLD